jgi:flagellar basal body-associated protein FliL
MAALITLVVLAAAIAIVAAPLLRKRPPPASEPARRAELESAREAKYREIRDAELDFHTGKLSEQDYESVNAALRVEAVAILDELRALQDERATAESD